MVRRWAAFALVGACSGALLNGQPPQPKPWTITGTVTDSLTRQPIAGASVVWEPSFAALGFRDRPLDEQPPSGAARVTTDAAGSFSVSADPSATGIRLFISHAGYRAQDGKTLATVLVAPNSPAVSIALVRQASIQGRVTDSAGDALAGIEVSLARVEIRDGRRQSRQVFTKSSGVNGDFVFDDLTAGVFYLRAAGQASGKTYGPVFYPAELTRDRARLLRVDAGQALAADFHLASHASYHIRGIVTNMPLRRGVSVRLQQGDDSLGDEMQASPSGAFDFSGVAPGDYTVQAYTPNLLPLNFGETAVTVGQRDVSAVRITLSEGGDIPGHIEFHGPGSLDKYAVVYATPFHPRHWPGEVKDTVAVMNPKGNFVLKNLQPGKYEISVRSLSDFYISEMRAERRTQSGAAQSGTLDTQDILGQGLTVPAGELPALAITMQSGAAEITGRIESASPGDLFSVALIVMRGGIAIPTIIRAADGRFQIPGLSPGDYTLLAWTDSRQVEYRNQASLLNLLPQGTAVSLAEGAKRSVTLEPVP